MKREPIWLSIEVVLASHEELVAEHGGVPLLRDRGLLESALAKPRHRFAYGETDVFNLATAYASGITRNHPFADGNKRTAFIAAYTFLGLNGWTLDAPEQEAYRFMLGLSDRTISEAAFAEWLRNRCVRGKGSRLPGGGKPQTRRRPRKPR